MSATQGLEPPSRWRDQGACKDKPLEWWYPEFPNGLSDPARLTPEAFEACGSCPVRERCLSWALHHEDHGIWGGTTENQRRRLRKAARIQLVNLVPRTRGWSIEDEDELTA